MYYTCYREVDSAIFFQIEIRMEAQNAVLEREKALNEEVSRLREQLERERAAQAQRVDQVMAQGGANAAGGPDLKKEGQKDADDSGGCTVM